jgi:hypothetical protein
MKNVLTLLVALVAPVIFGCEGKSETAKPAADAPAAAQPGAAASAAPAGAAKPAASGGW